MAAVWRALRLASDLDERIPGLRDQPVPCASGMEVREIWPPTQIKGRRGQWPICRRRKR